MNILIINYEFPPLGGGGGIFTRDLVKEFAKKHSIDIITTHFKGLKRKETLENINIYRVPVLYRTALHTATLASMLSFPFFGILKGIHLCLNKKYDIIQTHFAVPSGPVGLIISFLFRIPNVLTFYGGDIYNPYKKISPHSKAIFRWVVRTVINNATAVIAPSTNIRNNANKIYRPTKDISIIPFGIDTPFFTSLKREELSLQKDIFYIISIGRLLKTKGYDILIKALNIIHKSRSDIRLILIGEGPEQDNLEKLASDLDISDDIIFLGAVFDKRKFQFLSTADAYVLSSLYEGFGIVLLEAMFCGLPIVATNNGGQTDIVTDGRNGILVEPSDAQAIADAITRLIKDKELRQKTSTFNREDVKKYYISNIAQDYLKLFNNIVQIKKK